MLVQGYIEIRKKNAIALGLIEESRLFQLNREWELNKKNLLNYSNKIKQLQDAYTKNTRAMKDTFAREFRFDKQEDNDYREELKLRFPNAYSSDLISFIYTISVARYLSSEEITRINTLREIYKSKQAESNAAILDKLGVYPILTDIQYKRILGNISNDYWNLMKYITTYNRYSIEHWLNKSSITSVQAKYF